MLDKLLKYNSLGSKEEILFVLFNAISSTNKQSIDDIKTYCISHKYTISKSFDGIISLLNYVGFIDYENHKIKLQAAIFNRKELKKQNYFRNQHFYLYLFSTLISEKQLHKLFNLNNVQFDSNKSTYFIKSNLIPFKSFSLKNLLMSLEFLNTDMNNQNHLLINKAHIKTFEKFIITELKRKKKTKRQLSLKRLKEIQNAQEEAGMKAELFVLNFENERLNTHPFKEMIKIISSEFSNAGYDIESFSGFNSIVPNRFIEVKSYKDNVAFYWSKNETNTAEELGGDYFLYLVDRSKYHLKGYKPMIIKNPYNRIFDNDNWKIETETWKISLEK